MTGDLRGFSYDLEPLLKRQRWRLEALLIRLGTLQKAHLERSMMVAALREDHRAGSREAMQAIIRRCDPITHGRRLLWLTRLQDEIREGERRLEELDAERAVVRAKCLTQQQRLEVLERHKASRADEYLRQETGRAAKLSDQDWLVRQPSLRRMVRRRAKAGAFRSDETRMVNHG